MSWISNLAGKAESLLEQVDGVAATALKNQDEQLTPVDVSLREPEPPTHNLAPNTNQGSIARVSTERSIHGGPTAPIRARAPLTNPRPQAKVMRREQKNDDQLFEFLNSSAPPSKERRPNKAKLAEDSAEAVTTRQTISTTQENRPIDHTDRGIKNRETLTKREEPANETKVSLPSSEAEEPMSQAMVHEMAPATQPQHHASDHLSNLELENTLLRKEVASLNEEMVSVVQRTKEAERRLHEAGQQVQKTRQQLSASEGITRQLRSQESDYNEVLSAKDSQLAVLRVRIQEADQEMLNKKEQLTELQLQRERLLKDHTDSSGIQGHALASLKSKLEDTERSLQREQENHKRTQQEAMTEQSKLQQQQQSMADSLKNQQKKLNEEKNKASEHLAAVKASKMNLETARHDLKDYKEKAGRILQAKDKVISSLRGGGSTDEMSGVTTTEYEEVCRERDMHRDELNQMKYRVEQLKGDLQDMEQQQQSDADLAQENIGELETSLETEKRKREECEQELQQHVQDLKYFQEEVQRSKASVVGQIQEREAEIQKLRNQLATKALTSTSEEELENRVRALTENLIQKQTFIEALSTEKNSLVLQLERLEQQYRDVQASTARLTNGSTAVSLDAFDGDSDENTLSRVKSITSIMPYRLNESRQMKKAVNEIDKFSIRLGLFLRRYPIARLFVILYMILLHIWVLVVLLTYKPEMHDSDPPGFPHVPVSRRAVNNPSSLRPG